MALFKILEVSKTSHLNFPEYCILIQIRKDVLEMMIPLHELLKMIREEKKLSYEQLALKSHVSIDRLQQYESGSQVPSIQTILKLSSALEYPTSNLLDSLKIKH